MLLQLAEPLLTRPVVVLRSGWTVWTPLWWWRTWGVWAGATQTKPRACWPASRWAALQVRHSFFCGQSFDLVISVFTDVVDSVLHTWRLLGFWSGVIRRSLTKEKWFKVYRDKQMFMNSSLKIETFWVFQHISCQSSDIIVAITENRIIPEKRDLIRSDGVFLVSNCCSCKNLWIFWRLSLVTKSLMVSSSHVNMNEVNSSLLTSVTAAAVRQQHQL